MKQKIKFKGARFLTIVSILYILIMFIDFKSAVNSLLNALDVLNNIWPLFLFIIFLTTAINYFLKPKHIINHLGENSGTKGYVYALLAGIISHGPMYAWYGLLDDLKKHGVKDELLIVFLYARAIKIPMIPFSIAVFGTAFTIIISIYILLFALLQGKAYSYFKNKFL